MRVEAGIWWAKFSDERSVEASLLASRMFPRLHTFSYIFFFSFLLYLSFMYKRVSFLFIHGVVGLLFWSRFFFVCLTVWAAFFLSEGELGGEGNACFHSLPTLLGFNGGSWGTLGTFRRLGLIGQRTRSDVLAVNDRILVLSWFEPFSGREQAGVHRPGA